MSDGLQFDRAEFEAPPPGAGAEAAAVPVGPLCDFCGKQLREYWAIADKVACAGCHAQVRFALESRSGAAERFLKACLYGFGAGIAGALLWYLVWRLTGWHHALVAIAVGWLVGAAVKKGAEGRGGWVYQLLAVVLTYLAISAAYVPIVARVIQYSSEHPDLTAGDAPKDEALAAVEPDGFAYVLAVPFSLAAPFLSGILGILITGFGLFEAWRANTKVVIPITGPHAVGTGPPPAGTAPDSAPPPAAPPQVPTP